MRFRFIILSICVMVTAVSAQTPIQGIWLNRHLMAEGEEAVVEFLEDCQERGITHVMPNFWFHGSLIYPGSDLAPQHPDFVGWDPMDVVVREAHARGLQVWPWSEYGLFSHFNRTLDEADPGWILTEHPEWRIEDSEGHIGLRNDEFGAMHFSMNPAHPEARAFLIDLHMDVAERYDIDGINTDRFRHMGRDWGYDEYSLAAFAGDIRIDHSAPDAFDRWRVLMINDLVREFADRWRPAYPDLPITGAVNPPYMYERRFQHFHEWVAEGTFDLSMPMIYGDSDIVRREALAMREMLPEGAPWLAGLDAGRGDEALAELVDIINEVGASGVVIWDDTAWRAGSYAFERVATEGVGVDQAATAISPGSLED